MGLNPGDTNYCHNCGCWEILADGIWCAYCLEYWITHERMPGGTHIMAEIYKAIQYGAYIPSRPDWVLPSLGDDVLWIIAIDPGSVTGICLLAVPAYSIFFDAPREILYRHTLELKGSIQSQVSSACWLARVIAVPSGALPPLLLCEDFDLGGNSLQGSASEADIVIPVRWGAAIRHAVECGHAERAALMFQGRTQAFGTATDSRLRAWGMWDKGSDHKRDATRHAITILRRISEGSIDPREIWTLAS